MKQGALLPEEWLVNLGAFGVDLFFVLSGFLMVLISGPYFQRQRSAGDFLMKRFVRIWPLYAVFTTYAIARGIISAHPHSAAYDLQPLRILAYIFIPSFDMHSLVAPPVGVGWTLNYEVLFYLCFAATIAGRVKQPVVVLATALLILYLGGYLIPATALGVFLRNDIIFEFVLGSCFGAAFTRGWRPRLGWWWVLLGLSLVIGLHWIPLALPRVVSAGIAATLVLIGAVALDTVAQTPTWLIKAGDASYSTYLSHIFIAGAVVNRVLAIVVRSPAVQFAIPIAGFVAVAICIVAGGVIHIWVEKPLLNAASNAVSQILRRPGEPPMVTQGRRAL